MLLEGEALGFQNSPGPRHEIVTQMGQLWRGYKISADVKRWLNAFVVFAGRLRSAAVSLSDMQLPGCPLIFVNDAFCELSGFERKEVLGRNCRFLQGPATECSAVSRVVHALREGLCCTVKLRNYSRSGRGFDNLLMLQAVHDESGRHRFSVGFQLEVTGSAPSEQNLKWLMHLRHFFPRSTTYAQQVPIMVTDMPAYASRST